MRFKIQRIYVIAELLSVFVMYSCATLPQEKRFPFIEKRQHLSGYSFNWNCKSSPNISISENSTLQVIEFDKFSHLVSIHEQKNESDLMLKEHHEVEVYLNNETSEIDNYKNESLITESCNLDEIKLKRLELPLKTYFKNKRNTEEVESGWAVFGLFLMGFIVGLILSFILMFISFILPNIWSDLNIMDFRKPAFRTSKNIFKWGLAVALRIMFTLYILTMIVLTLFIVYTFFGWLGVIIAILILLLIILIIQALAANLFEKMLPLFFIGGGK